MVFKMSPLAHTRFLLSGEFIRNGKSKQKHHNRTNVIAILRAGNKCVTVRGDCGMTVVSFFRWKAYRLKSLKGE